MLQTGNNVMVITRDAVLTGTSLLDRISFIEGKISHIGLASGDKVAVLMPDEMYLTAIIWALLRNGITAVLIEPGKASGDLRSTIYNLGVKCIITTSLYDDTIMKPSIILAGNEDIPPSGSVHFTEEQIDNVLVPFVFLDGNNQDPLTISNHDVLNYFSELDTLLPYLENNNLMLFRDIPLMSFVMELVWASLHSIPVVIEQQDETFPFYRYFTGDVQQKMEFSLFYFGSYAAAAEKDKYKLLFDTVKYADNNGFSAVWTPERHFNEFGGMYPNPSVLSAALAVSTTNLQIRSGSLVAPLHHAARIAEDWSVIDNLSNGRVGISFASGWQCDDFIFYPDNFPHRHQHMIGQISMVRSLWKGEKVTFKNGLGKETEIGIFPKPVQKELPVWVTVSGRKETYIDAGRIGANILTHLLWQDTSDLAEKIALYRRSLQESGFDPASRTVSVMVHAYLGEDNESVKEKVKAPLKNYLRTSTELIQSMIKNEAGKSDVKNLPGNGKPGEDDIPDNLMEELVDIAFSRFYDQAGLLGTVDKAREFIVRLSRCDVNEVACLVDFGLGRDDIMDGLTYLNKLRALYNENGTSGYQAGVTHCTVKTLEEFKTMPGFQEHFSSQKRILVNTESFEKVPPSLLPYTSMLMMNRSEDEMSVKISDCISATKMEAGFTSPVSDEF